MAFGNGTGLGELMGVTDHSVESLRERFGDACLLIDATELVQAEEWTATDASVRVSTPDGPQMFPTSGAHVYALKKRAGSSADFVAVGRGEDNDVWLPHPSVSRFHAYLRVKGEAVVVQDAHSENGTSFDGKTVPAKGAGTAIPLGGKHFVRFGDVEAMVLSVKDLHELLVAR
jgi:hypothetical protein